MKIACLGWGSLIWKPEALKIQNKWFEDGPLLPIEFSRQSENGRITLIIDEMATSVRVLWSIMTVDTIALAIDSLKEREGIRNDGLIHMANANAEENGPIKLLIVAWLKSKQLDAAIWTGLSYSARTNNQRPTIEYVLNHLRQLNDETRKVAEEYIRNAPKQIDTPYRRRIEFELGWTYLG